MLFAWTSLFDLEGFEQTAGLFVLVPALFVVAATARDVFRELHPPVAVEAPEAAPGPRGVLSHGQAARHVSDLISHYSERDP
jgi:hypothetical protein